MTDNGRWAEMFATFIAAMKTFEDAGAPEQAVRLQIEAVRRELRAAENDGEPAAEAARAASASFEYWRAAYEGVQAATCRVALKEWTRAHLCTAHTHAQPPHNVSQGMMKAAIHLLWRRLYALEGGRWHADPGEAVRDAMTDPTTRGQEFTQRLLEEIAAERGLSAKAMMAEVCGAEPQA